MAGVGRSSSPFLCLWRWRVSGPEVSREELTDLLGCAVSTSSRGGKALPDVLSWMPSPPHFTPESRSRVHTTFRGSAAGERDLGRQSWRIQGGRGGVGPWGLRPCTQAGVGCKPLEDLLARWKCASRVALLTCFP